jgi:hypothetical protein
MRFELRPCLTGRATLHLLRYFSWVGLWNLKTGSREVIKAIPRGKVASYARIAALASNYRAAAQFLREL